MALPRLIKYEQPPRYHQLELELGQWFDTALGKSVLAIEKQILSHILPTRFGYHVLFNGVGPAVELLESSPIRHKVCVSPTFNKQAVSLLCASTTALPLENNSVDLIVLHHSLDYEQNPHGVLREMSRILIPGGSLVLVGFNPWSLWGGWKALRVNKPFKHKHTVDAKISAAPWNARFISPYRLTDWLALLEMEVDGCESGFYYPPIGRLGGYVSKMLHKKGWRGLDERHWGSRLKSKILAQRGAIYVMAAKKMTTCMTPVKPKLKIRRQRVMGVSVSDSRLNREK